MKVNYIGMTAPYTIGAKPTGGSPIPDPPVINSQPAAQNLYQTGGKVEIKGASVSGATNIIWQKQSGSEWVDTANTGETLSIAAGDVADAGQWRIKAVNGASQPVYSNAVELKRAYLFLQNDVDHSDPGLVKTGDFAYNWQTTAGGKYFSAYYYDAETNTQFTPAGATSGRAKATISSSDTNVAPTTSRDTGQWIPGLKAGNAVVTFEASNLKTTLNLTVK